jgi:hypothetical protein
MLLGPLGEIAALSPFISWSDNPCAARAHEQMLPL